MTSLSRTSLDAAAAGWLAGGPERAVDTVLVARLERGRIRVVDGDLVDRGLDRSEPFDAVVLDALGARGRRDLQTVRWRVGRDSRVTRMRVDLAAAGLLGERTWRGRPLPTPAGRRLLRELRSDPPPGAAWQLALHGRRRVTDRTVREALAERSRPDVMLAPRRRPWSSSSLGAQSMGGPAAAAGAWGMTGGVDAGGFGGFGGGCDAGGGGGGSC